MQAIHVVPAPRIPTPAIYLDVDRIARAVNNPRRRILDVTQLAASIDTYGLLQPLVVRENGDAYELIAGHRRLAAIQHLRGLDSARHAMWDQVPAIVLTADDERALLLAGQENLQRKDLSPHDQALYLELYVRKYGSVRKAAEVLKLSHTYVAQRCRVFADEMLVGPVMDNQLDVSSAQELLRVADPVVRARMIQQAIACSWSKSRIRDEVDAWHTGIAAQPCRPSLDGKLEVMLRELDHLTPDSLMPLEQELAERLMRRLKVLLCVDADAGTCASSEATPLPR
jgi:ParB family chromosome partitioning protein